MGVFTVTTAEPRPCTVTARLDTEPSAPDTYTVTVYLNTTRDCFAGYRTDHPLAAATCPDGTPLRLAFHASDRIHSHEAAAAAVFAVSNQRRADDDGQTWPAEIRPVSVGDVIKVTGPDHWIIHLSVKPLGFSAVAEPTTLVPLPGTSVTTRR
jgi:hypothetical protein